MGKADDCGWLSEISGDAWSRTLRAESPGQRVDPWWVEGAEAGSCLWSWTLYGRPVGEEGFDDGRGEGDDDALDVAAAADGRIEVPYDALQALSPSNSGGKAVQVGGGSGHGGQDGEVSNRKVDRCDVAHGGGCAPYEDAIPLRRPSWTVLEIDQVAAERSRTLGWGGSELAALDGSDVDDSGTCSCERGADVVAADARQLSCVLGRGDC